ncbi:MAG: hypothetical protein ACE5K8_04310 [Candidatus Zixiibacteriota bacterium]
MESILSQAGSWGGLLGSLALVLASYLANRYVIPFLQVGKRQHYAQFVATIADEVTDDLRTKYPNKQWLKHLDEAVDRLIEICGVSREIARRAINAAAARK